MQDVPKIVRARLQWPSPATAAPHPDADLLPAFAEQSLAAQERGHVLEHLARRRLPRGCCAGLAGHRSRALARSVSTARIGWLSWPALRWGMVAAGPSPSFPSASCNIASATRKRQWSSTQPYAPGSDSDIPARNQPAPHATAPEAITPQAEMGKQTEMATQPPARAQTQRLSTTQLPLPVQVQSSRNRSPPAAQVQQAGSAEVPPPHRGTFQGNAASSRDFRSAPVPQNPAAAADQNSTLAGTTTVEVSSGEAPQVAAQTTAQSQVQDQLIQNEPAVSSQAPADFVNKAKPPSAQAFPPSMALPPPLRKAQQCPAGRSAPVARSQRSLDGGKTWLDVDITADNSMSSKLRFVLRARRWKCRPSRRLKPRLKPAKPWRSRMPPTRRGPQRNLPRRPRPHPRSFAPFPSLRTPLKSGWEVRVQPCITPWTAAIAGSAWFPPMPASFSPATSSAFSSPTRAVES